MDLYQDDPTSLPAKAEGIRVIAEALGVTITVNNSGEIMVFDGESSVLLYPDPEP